MEMPTVSDNETKLVLGRNLKRLRGDISFAELGRRCGTCATAIKEIEEGKRMPGVGLLTRIADALDVAVDSLLSHNPKNSRRAS